jgi:hypothetical protein
MVASLNGGGSAEGFFFPPAARHCQVLARRLVASVARWRQVQIGGRRRYVMFNNHVVDIRNHAAKVSGRGQADASRHDPSHA